jgi:hypothetical protein
MSDDYIYGGSRDYSLEPILGGARLKDRMLKKFLPEIRCDLRKSILHESEVAGMSLDELKFSRVWQEGHMWESHFEFWKEAAPSIETVGLTVRIAETKALAYYWARELQGLRREDAICAPSGSLFPGDFAGRALGDACWAKPRSVNSTDGSIFVIQNNLYFGIGISSPREPDFLVKTAHLISKRLRSWERPTESMPRWLAFLFGR